MAKTNPEQLPLMPVADHHRENGRRLLALLNRALRENGVSRSRLAEETGRDSAQVTRVLDGDGNLPGDILSAVLELDRLRIVVTGLCALAGLECRPKTPDLAGENRRLREELASVRTHIDRLLGDEP